MRRSAENAPVSHPVSRTLCCAMKSYVTPPSTTGTTTGSSPQRGYEHACSSPHSLTSDRRTSALRVAAVTLVVGLAGAALGYVAWGAAVPFELAGGAPDRAIDRAGFAGLVWAVGVSVTGAVVWALGRSGHRDAGVPPRPVPCRAAIGDQKRPRPPGSPSRLPEPPRIRRPRGRPRGHVWRRG